jgi:hypothetical protein
MQRLEKSLAGKGQLRGNKTRPNRRARISRINIKTGADERT